MSTNVHPARSRGPIEVLLEKEEILIRTFQIYLFLLNKEIVIPLSSVFVWSLDALLEAVPGPQGWVQSGSAHPDL